MPATPFLAVCFPNMKHSYEKYTSPDVKFLATMEHIPFSGGKPTPIKFVIDSFGVTLKQDRIQEVYFKKSAPRAGKQ